MRAIGGRSITGSLLQGSGQKRVLIFERFTIYNCFQKFNCEPIDKTKQHNVCEKETDLTNILVVLIAVGIKTLLDCSSTIVPLGLLIVVKVVMVMMVMIILFIITVMMIILFIIMIMMIMRMRKRRTNVTASMTEVAIAADDGDDESCDPDHDDDNDLNDYSDVDHPCDCQDDDEDEYDDRKDDNGNDHDDRKDEDHLCDCWDDQGPPRIVIMTMMEMIKIIARMRIMRLLG